MIQSLVILILFFSSSTFGMEPRLFCHGEGIGSTLFFWDGEKSHEFVDLQFKQPNYLGTYMACTNFLFNLNIPDRNRKITYAPLLNPLNKSLIRFADNEKSLFYDFCQEDISCHVKFPYSLLTPKIFWKQTFNKKEVLSCDDDRPALLPTAFRLPDQLPGIDFWELPKDDLITKFWEVAKRQDYETIIVSSMTLSLTFLNSLKETFKGSSIQVYILASFNLMSLDENITLTLKDLPPNILFIPIFQSSQSPHSHHQKGAVFIGKKKTTLIWNASNFRRYETHKLVDIGITITDSQLANIFTQRWINTAFTSCSEVKTINCNLQTRFSNSPKELDFWKSMTDRNCQQLPDAGKPLAKTLNAEDLILDLISKAKKTIYVHTHIFGNSLILKKFKEAQARGIDVKIIGGKPSTFNPQLPWVKFKLEKHEYHAKFMLFDDTTFIWGTGNITKSSLNNHREDFFYGSNPKILSKLKKYFEMSWH